MSTSGFEPNDRFSLCTCLTPSEGIKLLEAFFSQGGMLFRDKFVMCVL
jgi:hypothetical protein